MIVKIYFKMVKFNIYSRKIPFISQVCKQGRTMLASLLLYKLYVSFGKPNKTSLKICKTQFINTKQENLL